MTKHEIIAALYKLANEYARRGDHDGDLLYDAFWRLAEILNDESV